MSHPIYFGMKDLTLTAPQINMYTDDNNGMQIDGNQVATVAETTITGPPTVDVGTITAYTTDGVLNTPAVIKIKYDVQDGNFRRVSLRVPALQVTGTTGAPTVVNVVGATLLPTIVGPGISALNYVVDIVNASTPAVGRLVVQNTGQIQLSITSGAAFTNTFGLAQEVSVDYITSAT